MFTGIVETTARVAGIEATAAGARLTLDAGAVGESARVGDSVAVNGVCLTVVSANGPRLGFDAVPETLSRSSLGELHEGALVNLERPLVAGGRLDGHIVQGHVDGVGHIAAVREEGDSHRLAIRAPEELRRYIVEKGSIAVDGISLTVATLRPDGFEVAIIPHTWQVTNLHSRPVGSRVNLEVDILAKYVERLLQPRPSG